MGTYTTNLNLYNTNMSTDGNDTFDFQRDINDNNDKIDSAVGNLSSLNTTEQSSLVGAINEVISNCGTLSSLSTTAKNNLVSAINELVGNLDGFASKSLGNLNSTGRAVIDKKVEVEALLASNGYAKFSWKKNNTTSKLLLQWGKTSTATKNPYDITFPTSFSNANYSPVVTGNGTNVRGWMSRIISKTATTMSCGIYYGTNTGVSSDSGNYSSCVQWFAIGY